jgi:hypothetical protein
LRDPRQAAEKLGLQVWDFLADFHHDRESVTEEAWAAIRTAAFRFSREVKPADIWQVTYGRALAGAVLLSSMSRVRVPSLTPQVRGRFRPLTFCSAAALPRHCNLASLTPPGRRC